MAFTTTRQRKSAWRAGLFCLALLGVISIARAAGAADSGLIDLDGDKRISYDEFVHSAAVKAMKDMDTDKNGTLSRGEVRAAGSKPVSGSTQLDFSKLDTNHDGQVSVTEIKKPLGEDPQMKKTFRDLDKNNDGYLSGAELNEVEGGAKMRVVPQVSIGL